MLRLLLQSQSRDLSARQKRMGSLGAALTEAGPWVVGRHTLHFYKRGVAWSPWGGGTWGRMEVVGPGGAELYADFMGQQHVLADAGWPKVRSTRCGDLENVTITVEV